MSRTALHCAVHAVVAPEQWGVVISLCVLCTNFTCSRPLPDRMLNSRRKEGILSFLFCTSQFPVTHSTQTSGCIVIHINKSCHCYVNTLYKDLDSFSLWPSQPLQYYFSGWKDKLWVTNNLLTRKLWQSSLLGIGHIRDNAGEMNITYSRLLTFP